MADDINKLKQLALSGFVVLTFIAYSAQQRGDKPDDGVVVPRPQTSQSSSSNNSPTTTPPATNQASTGMGMSMRYKDGNYTGIAADAYYGNIQVQVIIQGGKITDVLFLQHPQDNSNSVAINQQAMPFLKQEAIAAQSSHVNIVSGATDTSMAFIQSLASALVKAH